MRDKIVLALTVMIFRTTPGGQRPPGKREVRLLSIRRLSLWHRIFD